MDQDMFGFPYEKKPDICSRHWKAIDSIKAIHVTEYQQYDAGVTGKKNPDYISIFYHK